MATLADSRRWPRRRPTRPSRRAGPTPTGPSRTRAGPSGTSARRRACSSGSRGRTGRGCKRGRGCRDRGWRGPGLAGRLSLGGRFPEGPDELVPVLVELADLALDAGRDLVDRHEERQLAVAEGVDDLAVAAGDLEDADPVGDQLDLGQVLVQGRPAVQVGP